MDSNLKNFPDSFYLRLISVHFYVFTFHEDRWPRLTVGEVTLSAVSKPNS